MGMGNGPESTFGPTSVPIKADHWQETWRDTADTVYVRGLYENAQLPSDFSMNDVGAGGSEVQTKETDVVDYSLSYPRARTLDYCTIPDAY